MNDIKIFCFEDADIRIIEEKGAPWFCATDICRVLGYENALAALSRHCYAEGRKKFYVTDSTGRQQETNFVDEKNLYRLILRSKLPTAEKFQNWVYEEALPSFLKFGKPIIQSSKKEIIHLTTASIGGNAQQGVNARDLHEFLEIKTAFKDWIRRRIDDFGFTENVDFVKFEEKSNCSNLSGAQGKVEYLITLSMAKELSMVERNEKGKQARLYFIECEKVAKESTQRALPQTYAEALRALANEVEAREALQQKTTALEFEAKENAPKVAMAERAMQAEGAYLVRVVAKVVGVTQTMLFDFMRTKGILSARNEPYASFVKNGVIRPRLSTYTDANGNERTSVTPYVTMRGIEYLIAQLLKAGKIKDKSQVQMGLLA